MKKVILTSTCLMLFLVAGLRMSLIAQDDSDIAPAKDAGAEAKAAMVAAAEKTYEAAAAGYDAGTATTADVYTWSRRWAVSERGLAETKRDEAAALMGHWRRMGRLNSKVEALWRNGVRGGENEKYFATKYYLAEAELMLAEAGALQPKRDN